MRQGQDLVEQAIELGGKGYYVLPLLIREDGSKHPLSKWSTEATPDADKIRALNWEDATHVAVACEPSGIVVIDIDPYVHLDEYQRGTEIDGEELLEEWQKLCESHGESRYEYVNDPTIAFTFRNGIHLFLKSDPEKPMTNSVKDLTPCIDVRGVGGIVAIYADENMMPLPDSLPSVPDWLYELTARESDHLTPPSPPKNPEFPSGERGTAYGIRGLDGELDKITKSWDDDDGRFNHTLNRSAYAVGQLVGGGQLDYEATYDELRNLLEHLGAPSDQYKSLDSGFASGYQRPREPTRLVFTDESLTNMSERWLSPTELRDMPPPRWLIPGWLEQDSVAQIYGKPKGGKSFIALDMAAKLSRGLTWPEGTPSTDPPLKVAYVLAEGVSGFVLRVGAWEEHHEVPLGDVRFYPEALQVRSKDWELATEYLASWRPSLIVVDTQARCTVGMDENLPKDVNEVYVRIEEMRKRTGACVLLIHHTNKLGDSARGSNAILANINTEIVVGRVRRGVISVTNTAQKNAESATKLFFSLTEAGESVVPVLILDVDLSPGGTDEPNPSYSKVRVAQQLQVRPGVPQTTNELLEATGLAKSNLHRTLNDLMSDDKITRSEIYRNNRNQAAYVWRCPDAAVAPPERG